MLNLINFANLEVYDPRTGLLPPRCADSATPAAVAQTRIANEVLRMPNVMRGILLAGGRATHVRLSKNDHDDFLATMKNCFPSKGQAKGSLR